MNELLINLDKLHTTELGVGRIKRNLLLDTDEVVAWCKAKIESPDAVITRNGKNWYINIDGCIITVNAHSYTIWYLVDSGIGLLLGSIIRKLFGIKQNGYKMEINTENG